MDCWCNIQFLEFPQTFFNIDFSEFGERQKQFCQDWFVKFSIDNLVIYGSGFVVILINVIAHHIFVFTSKNEKQYHLGLENLALFYLIFIETGFDCGVSLVFADKNFLSTLRLDTYWFLSLGSSLCFAMVLEIISTKQFTVLQILANLGKRWKDRGFKMSFVNGNSDTPITKKLRQQDLDSLYTGNQIQIGKQFA